MKYMRKSFALILVVTLLFSGGYFYYIAQAVCPIPITYSLGTLDPQFGLSTEQARLVIAEAESVWEDATGRNLFSYEENDGKLLINFVYDDRQEFVAAEGELKEKLDATENISEAIRETYASLVAQYNELRMSYADRVELYERQLNAYNEEVERYNREGGAPEEVYARLSQQKKELNKEQASLNTLSNNLNKLVAEINSIGDKGNSIISNYNQGVSVYNQTFGESREFTQGDYTNNVIHIYTFEDLEELKLVMVHELGHALSLNHVEGEKSTMYYLIGKQEPQQLLTDADLQEFNRVCGEKSFFEQIKVALSSYRR